MSSAAQILANRQNSQHSTGPVTDAGKARSSQNSFRHGLASSQIVIPGESESEYEALLAGLTADHKPQSVTESILVYKMATHHWLSLRAIAMQAREAANPESTPRAVNVLVRYQTANERGFWKSFDTLRKLQKERAEPQIGFASQPAPASAPAAPTESAEPAPQPESIWKKHPGLGSLPPSRKRKRY